MDFSIRYAAPEEASMLHSMIHIAFDEYRGKIPAPPGALNESMAEVERDIAEGRVLVALRGEQAVGTVRYTRHPDYLYVGRLAVLPDHRHQGVGAALMAFIEDLAPTLGYTQIKLGTRRSMPGNIAFYTGLGYKVIAEMPHSSGVDVVVWFAKQLG